jgi:serine/threonine protein kinase
MINLPDFTQNGYQVIKELGHNSEGGRFTYLAQRLADQVQVVVKQFQFARGATGWDGFKAVEKEIKSLQGLNHRGIPKYLDQFDTPDSFCIVTEYFAADTLAAARSFTPEEIKSIAVQTLEILVYLQERIPPVIHRDIKPENILVDKDLNVYLIDFGFARVGSGTVAMSSAAAGTFGFMAPEQIRNLKLTNASDLYGLGLTLICLIGAIRSVDIGNYIDFSNQLDRSKIDPKLKGCSLTFVKWLDQMVAPDPSKRFPDAAMALEALKPLYVVRVPEVQFDKSVLEFRATKLGEKLTQTITISNPIPETVLEGYWEVAPHPHDPPHTPDSHAWISISQRQIKGNHTECSITVDTSKLWAESQGNRKLIFHGNAESASLTIQIETAPCPVKLPREQYSLEIACSGFLIFFMSSVFYKMIGWVQVHRSIAFDAYAEIYNAALTFTLAMTGGVTVCFIGKAELILLCMMVPIFMGWDIALVGGFGGLLEALFVKHLFTKYYNSLSESDKHVAYVGFWLRYFTGIIFGSTLTWHIMPVKLVLLSHSDSKVMMVMATLLSGITLAFMHLSPILNHRKQLAAYRTQEQHLIKP